MPTFRLRFDLSEIPDWEQAYWSTCDDADKARAARVDTVIGPFMREHHYLTMQHFTDLSYWKSPRSKTYAARNDEAFLCAVTHTALTTENERLRSEVLTLLCGVGWPMASVILHFGSANLYPILDVRALWSAGIDDVDAAVYNFALWREYTRFCRDAAARAGMPLPMWTGGVSGGRRGRGRGWGAAGHGG